MKCLCQVFFYGLLTILIISCGTHGHIQFYNFNASKDVVEENLLAVINKDSLYSPPPKWHDYELGEDSIYDIFIYFKTLPSELYQVRFTNRDSWSNSNFCKLGLVSVFDGELWRYEDNSSSNEERRLKKRFETEILSKMKYQYSKQQ